MNEGLERVQREWDERKITWTLDARMPEKQIRQESQDGWLYLQSGQLRFLSYVS